MVDAAMMARTGFAQLRHPPGFSVNGLKSIAWAYEPQFTNETAGISIFGACTFPFFPYLL
jgi:hypothetical protein